MPRAYAGVAFAFQNTGVDATISRRLQLALDDLCSHLPWLTGRILPIGSDGETFEKGEVRVDKYEKPEMEYFCIVATGLCLGDLGAR